MCARGRAGMVQLPFAQQLSHGQANVHSLYIQLFFFCFFLSFSYLILLVSFNFNCFKIIIYICKNIGMNILKLYFTASRN